MYLYCRTPLLKSSKYIPHLVEHCTGHASLSSEDFFEFSYGLDGICTADYTRFEYDEWVEYNKAIEKILLPIKQEDFAYETKVLQQELEESSYDQRIYEFIIKHYIDPQINLNKEEYVSFDRVLDYHSLYYKKENIIAVDQNFNLFYTGFTPKIKNIKEKNLYKNLINFEEDTYKILLQKNYSAQSFWKLYFIFWMCCFYNTYVTRRKIGEYYYLEPYFHRYGETCWVLLPKINYTAMESDFFNSGKQYIINMFKQGYFKEQFFLNEYFYGISIPRDSVIQQYHSYSFKEIQTLLQG